MASFYEEMQGVATELLNEFNQGTLVYRSVTGGTSPYDGPAVTTDVPINGTARGVSQKYLSDLITASDIEVTAAVFTPAPTLSGTLFIDGTERQIIKIVKIPEAGTTVAYKLFVKG